MHNIIFCVIVPSHSHKFLFLLLFLYTRIYFIALKVHIFLWKKCYARPITSMFIGLSKNLDCNWKIENPSVLLGCNRF